ncbi:MAG: DUF938 domain-containing protein [Microcoleaceae cyanobacterium]
MTSSEDTRQYAPATERNRQPILQVLQQVLPPTGTILEVASGTGQHAAYFAPRLTPRHWQPTDPSPQACDSIAAWRLHTTVDTLHPPLILDATATQWPIETSNDPLFKDHPISAIVNINMIHISPWSACLGLMAGAKRILPTNGVLYLYGPYKRAGKHTASSNAAFDQSLQMSNPQWGVRDLEAVVAQAEAEGFRLKEVVQMPANNLSVIFAR